MNTLPHPANLDLVKSFQAISQENRQDNFKLLANAGQRRETVINVLCFDSTVSLAVAGRFQAKRFSN